MGIEEVSEITGFPTEEIQSFAANPGSKGTKAMPLKYAPSS